MKLPDTRSAIEALRLLNSAAPEEVVNHSIRSFLLGQAYALKKKIEFEEEELYIAALFHDLGLCNGYRNRSLPFQVSGSRALCEFLNQRNAEPERIKRMVDAVDYHLQLLPKWSLGTTAGLLQVGAWMDVMRFRYWTISNKIREIELAYPRMGFNAKLPSLVLSSIGGFSSCVGLIFPGRFKEKN